MKAFCQAEQCWVSWLYLIIVEAPDVKQGFALVTRVLWICSALSLVQHPQPGYRSFHLIPPYFFLLWVTMTAHFICLVNKHKSWISCELFFLLLHGDEGLCMSWLRDADYFQLFCWHVRMGPSWSAADIHHHWSLNPALRSQTMSSPWVWVPQTWEVENPDPKLEAQSSTYDCLVCAACLICVSMNKPS